MPNNPPIKTWDDLNSQLVKMVNDSGNVIELMHHKSPPDKDGIIRGRFEWEMTDTQSAVLYYVRKGDAILHFDFGTGISIDYMRKIGIDPHNR